MSEFVKKSGILDQVKKLFELWKLVDHTEESPCELVYYKKNGKALFRCYLEGEDIIFDCFDSQEIVCNYKNLVRV